MRRTLVILGIILLLILAGCAKAECKKDVDCTARSAKAFTVKCVEKKCQYTPIPNICGNSLCDGNENKCTCSQDCGACSGKVPGSQYLSQQCLNDKCTEDVPQNLIKPIFSTTEATSAGDKFKLDTAYNAPFNMNKDTFDITVTLAQQAPQNRDQKILRAELLGATKDRRTITLASWEINKPLWAAGSTLQEEAILDFPTVELEGELTGLTLKVYYEYSILQAGKKTQRPGQFQITYKDKLVFVKPSSSYPCPASCEDKNPGTRDICSAQTNYFCRHEPIPLACGNFQCDGNENKCSCVQDCGQCSGSAGNFLDFTCKLNQCVVVLKPGTAVQPNSLFDDRSLGPVQLNNNYKFTNPLNVKTDKFNLEFKVYRKDPSVSEVAIETVRLLEGPQQLAELGVNREITESPSAVQIGIPSTTLPEEDHQITLGVWYKYVQNGAEKRGNYQKPLGKVTLISPE